MTIWYGHEGLRWSFLLVTAGVSAFALLTKSWFLAPTRLGWLMMVANVPIESGCRGRRMRWHFDALALVGGSALWALGAGPWAALAWALTYGSAWAYALHTDLRWRNGELTVQDEVAARSAIPLPLPRLILRVEGPVLERGRALGLGTWPEGRRAVFAFRVLNPADKVHCQRPIRLDLTPASDAVRVSGDIGIPVRGPDPGEVVTLRVEVVAVRESGVVDIPFRLVLETYEVHGTLRLKGILPAARAAVRSVRVDRWKGGARAAWAWRGDTDLYDPATWQSAEGLAPSFELSRRFRVPYTMFVSARLSFDEAESRAHSLHLGVDRRSEEIPSFIEWWKENVTLATWLEWPFASEKPFACELANHYWLHYGTQAAADPGNGWKIGARPGEGRYPWSSADGDSRKEQTDNARKCAETYRELFGYVPAAWGIPGRASDGETPAAIEASGMAVSSDADCQAFVNVFKQPPPHHPLGTTRLVELSKKYPGDPMHGNQLAMLKYWNHAALRNGRAMIFMAHQHLRGYESAACYRLTEEMLRDTLTEGAGSFWVATMSAVGLYWDRVLCPEHRWVEIVGAPGNPWRIRNRGDEALEQVPVEVELEGGARMLVLVDLAARGEALIGTEGGLAG